MSVREPTVSFITASVPQDLASWKLWTRCLEIMLVIRDDECYRQPKITSLPTGDRNPLMEWKTVGGICQEGATHEPAKKWLTRHYAWCQTLACHVYTVGNWHSLNACLLGRWIRTRRNVHLERSRLLWNREEWNEAGMWDLGNRLELVRILNGAA